MEAMACGLVPICLRIRSGVTELVEDGVTGLLVDDRGDGLVSAVKRIAAQPEYWQRLSRNARDKMYRDYSNEVCATRWEELFRELQARASAAGLPKIPARLRLPPSFDRLHGIVHLLTRPNSRLGR
jgi:glycosyltransferase involved in cell wall biosynthesis